MIAEVAWRSGSSSKHGARLRRRRAGAVRRPHSRGLRVLRREIPGAPCVHLPYQSVLLAGVEEIADLVTAWEVERRAPVQQRLQELVAEKIAVARGRIVEVHSPNSCTRPPRRCGPTSPTRPATRHHGRATPRTTPALTAPSRPTAVALTTKPAEDRSADGAHPGWRTEALPANAHLPAPLSTTSRCKGPMFCCASPTSSTPRIRRRLLT